MGILLGSGVLQAAQPTAPSGTPTAFRVAEPHYRYQFPRDHGSHPGFKIEWWYLTGQLKHAHGDRRFGFQATFFRRGLHPQSQDEASSPPFLGGQQIYLAHMALLDVESGAFHYEERIHRNGWDAHADVHTLDVRNGNWSLKGRDDFARNEAMTLQGSVRAEAAFEFQLQPLKPKVIFGKEGVSRKGADPSAASHYITFTRLGATGTIQLEGETIPITGTAWMDHEISSSQLDEHQVGWDWASVQLNTGEEIMVYVMRRDDGGVDPFSTLAWVTRDSQLTHLQSDAFRWSPTGFWDSPHSGARYPIESELRFQPPHSQAPLTLRFKPLVRDQEIQGELGGIRYWEGACDVLDEENRSIGTAYVELTGYDGKLAQRIR